MANFTDPVKVAFGRFLGGFHQTLIADTKAMAEFAARPFAKSVVLVPGRMIDQVEEALAAWRKNDTSGEARATPFLPIMMVAVSKDYQPAQADYTRLATAPQWVQIPGDPKARAFKMRVAHCEVRIQVVIAAAEDATATSIAMQLQLYASAFEHRRIYAEYPLAGVATTWPIVFKEPDVSAVPVPSDQKNLTIKTVDFYMVASVPMLAYPKDGELDADGQGSGSYQDPDGYLTVQVANIAAWGDVNPDPDAIPPGAEPDETQVGEFP